MHLQAHTINWQLESRGGVAAEYACTLRKQVSGVRHASHFVVGGV